MNRMSVVSIGFKVTPGYRNYVLAILWVAGVFSFLDRQVFSVLLESIKADMRLTDTELGLIGGFAISLFYAIFGLILGNISDRFSRRNMLAACVALWSLMTAVCGLANNFATLFLARVGVGVGEAGGTPASASLLADYFPPQRRSTAFAVLGMSIPGGVLVGFMVGGVVNEYFGWRAAFAAVGLPGLLVAAIIRLTLREPPRGYSENRRDFETGPKFIETLKYYLSVKTYHHLTMGTALFALGALGSGVWAPAYFQRVYGLSSGEAGIWLGLIYGIGGMGGALTGGLLSDFIVKKTGDVKWHFLMPAASLLGVLPFAAFIYLSSSAYPAFVALIAFVILQNMPMGPANAMMQSLAGLRMRATIAAIMGFLTSALPAGLGPLIVGMASDRFTPVYGHDTLRYAILGTVVVAYSWSALHFYLASRTLARDLAAAQEL